MSNKTDTFFPIAIPMHYTESLVRLYDACDTLGVEITGVEFFRGGYLVRFANWKGTAILHDDSYGHEAGAWETFGFPWDHDGYSIHFPNKLAALLSTYSSEEE